MELSEARRSTRIAESRLDPLTFTFPLQEPSTQDLPHARAIASAIGERRRCLCSFPAETDARICLPSSFMLRLAGFSCELLLEQAVHTSKATPESAQLGRETDGKVYT